jgi:endonuclease YncB( thermonuclease family)
VKTIRSLSPSVFAVGFLVLLLTNTVLGQATVVRGRVVGVTDGDTLKVLVACQQLLRIRLAFCDAPEKRQAFGTRARQAMSELVFGKDIELRQHAIDRYGRTVAQVRVDGKDVGAEMVRRGLAWVYDGYITEASTEIQESYRKAQEEAKAESRSAPRANDRFELDRSTPKANRSEYTHSAVCNEWIGTPDPVFVDGSTMAVKIAERSGRVSRIGLWAGSLSVLFAALYSGSSLLKVLLFSATLLVISVDR